MTEDDLKKIAKMVVEMNSSSKAENISVIKVGGDKPTDQEMVDRYKRSNQQLRRKIERFITEKAKMELELKRLRDLTCLKSEDEKDQLLEAFRDRCEKLETQLEIANNEEDRLRDNCRKSDQNLYEAKKQLLEISEENKTIVSECALLKEENKKLLEELRIRIAEQKRVNFMDI